MKRALLLGLAALLIISPLGCASKTGGGGLIGAATGAAAGAAIGNATGNTAVGAILGAAIGGAAGAYIGQRMDKAANEMREDLDGATIERHGEGIKITFDSGILFGYDSADLQPASVENINKLATILNKYDDTVILIEGHTDSDGKEEYNQALSERRAQSVANQLAALQVANGRFTIKGYGEMQPVADNETTEGKAQNRRVDLAIMANDELKKEAERATGG